MIILRQPQRDFKGGNRFRVRQGRRDAG